MSSETTFGYFDYIYRSRKTLLRILSERGYNTKPFEKFGPEEIEAMVLAGKDSLRMDLERPADFTDSPITKCRVLYEDKKLKPRLAGFLRQLTEEDAPDRVDPKTTEVILMLANPEGEPVVDVHHVASYDQWLNKKLRISFFPIANLVNHPADHIKVPKHERIPKAEVPFTKEEQSKLPIIRFHEDIQARVLGLIPFDVVKITRSSASSGSYTNYRICLP